jgi:hypothetical protein
MIQLKPGQPLEIRPVIASIREDNAYAYYDHMVTPLTTVDVSEITVPKGVRGILVQAEDQNIRYTITDASSPSQTSGFILIAGNDPLLISVLQNQVIRFIAEAAGAILQLQYVQ